MKARLERDWVGNSVKLWLYQQRGEGTALLLRSKGGDIWEWEEIAEGVLLEPTLVLPPEALEALVAEAQDFLPPSGAQAAHLTDIKAVRDRLLRIVEHKAGLRDD